MTQTCLDIRGNLYGPLTDIQWIINVLDIAEPRSFKGFPCPISVIMAVITVACPSSPLCSRDSAPGGRQTSLRDLGQAVCLVGRRGMGLFMGNGMIGWENSRCALYLGVWETPLKQRLRVGGRCRGWTPFLAVARGGTPIRRTSALTFELSLSPSTIYLIWEPNPAVLR